MDVGSAGGEGWGPQINIPGWGCTSLYGEQHVGLGKGQGSNAQGSSRNVAPLKIYEKDRWSYMHGHPCASDEHVLIFLCTPHEPQVSLHETLIVHELHVPYGGQHVQTPAGGSTGVGGCGPQ